MSEDTDNGVVSELPYSAYQVGKRLRIARRAFGNLSQAEFARRAGLSASALGNWEQGRQRPNMDAAEAIIDAFGLTLDYLFLGRVGTLRHEVATAIIDAERALTSESSDRPD